MNPYEEELIRRWTLREIRMIEGRQREMRFDWCMAKFRRELPIVILACLAASIIALAIIVGVN